LEPRWLFFDENDIIVINRFQVLRKESHEMQETSRKDIRPEPLENLFRELGIAHTPPLTVAYIAGGQSNLTYRVDDARGRKWVLRRPPLGTTLESAHDVLREYRIVSALSGSAVPVAPPVVGSSDTSYLGVPFAVYDFAEGIVLRTTETASELEAPERYVLGEAVFDVLADLHLLNPDSRGLGTIGPREGYIERQLRRWSKQWEAQSPHRLPEWEEVRVRLAAELPRTQRVSIVHGDYRLGNLIVAAGEVRAVLDWELCTLGDPLADLAYLANTWLRPDEPELWECAPTRIGGFPLLDDLLHRYAARTRLDLSDFYLYRSFSQWRTASILEGVRMRTLAAHPGEPYATSLAASVEALAKDALTLLDRR
jgi:aminoglycoside phosphotransferase (APT) family kinase protein